jgi:hypothetical protein
MSFLAKLTIDGQTYNILECFYKYNQSIDSSGRPHGGAQGGQIRLKIESTGKNGFLDWMLSPDKSKEGTITYYKRDAMSRLQEIKFEKGFCIEFSEMFNATNAEALCIEMLITSDKISYDNVVYQNNWSR